MVEAGSGGQLDGEADVGFGIGWGTAPWQAAPLIDADAGNHFRWRGRSWLLGPLMALKLFLAFMLHTAFMPLMAVGPFMTGQ